MIKRTFNRIPLDELRERQPQYMTIAPGLGEASYIGLISTQQGMNGVDSNPDRTEQIVEELERGHMHNYSLDTITPETWFLEAIKSVTLAMDIWWRTFTYPNYYKLSVKREKMMIILSIFSVIIFMIINLSAGIATASIIGRSTVTYIYNEDHTAQYGPITQLLDIGNIRYASGYIDSELNPYVMAPTNLTYLMLSGGITDKSSEVIYLYDIINKNNTHVSVNYTSTCINWLYSCAYINTRVMPLTAIWPYNNNLSELNDIRRSGVMRMWNQNVSEYDTSIMQAQVGDISYYFVPVTNNWNRYLIATILLLVTPIILFLLAIAVVFFFMESDLLVQLKLITYRFNPLSKAYDMLCTTLDDQACCEPWYRRVEMIETVAIETERDRYHVSVQLRDIDEYTEIIGPTVVMEVDGREISIGANKYKSD